MLIRYKTYIFILTFAEAKPSRKKKKSKSRKTSFEKQEKRNGSFRETTADYINKNTL